MKDAGGVTVIDRTTNRRFDLKAGKDYEVEVVEVPSGVRLFTRTFTLTRGGKEIVNVRHELANGGKPAAAVAKMPAGPAPVAEPPPLEEWLKGHTVVTVAQDGSGHFRTIQAALDALKPHQVVRVLDRGPYKERLVLRQPPEDIGLVSEQKTVIELAEWATGEWTVGHVIRNTKGFRLHGFLFLGRPLPDSFKRHAQLTAFVSSSGLVIEKCRFSTTPPKVAYQLEALAVSWPERPEEAQRPSSFIRHCEFIGRLSARADHPHAGLVVQQNYFHDYPTQPVLLSGMRPRISVRYNVFGSGTTGIITWAVPREFAGRLEITNNTFQQGRLQFSQGVPQRRVTVRNNIFPDNIWFVDDPDHPQPKALEIPNGWQVDHNCFGGTTTGKYSVPVTARDVRADPQFLSRDPSHVDYLRLPANSPLGKAGAGGMLPDYSGALPPGPAPKEGDWFTRLRAHWRDALPPPAGPAPEKRKP